MMQFVEVRHNPIALPSCSVSGQYQAADELIFIAAQNEYTLNHKYESQQHIICHQFRCMANNADKRRLILSIAQLLHENDPIGKAILAAAQAEIDEEEAAK